jgi:hypothetical protein
MSKETEEQEAREAERREAERRAAILAEIRSLESKLQDCEELCESLRTSGIRIDDQISQWISLYNTESQKEIIKYVKVKDVFEGVIADELSVDFRNAIDEMNKNQEESEDLSNKVDSQIGSLQNYIDELNSRISSLYASL